MALKKLEIRVEDGEPIEALFNPNQITIQKAVNWSDAPTQGNDVPHSQFNHGQPATLTMELFFDTYEKGKDVYKEYTKKIFALTTVETHGEIHRPPICTLMWGEWRIFQGYLQQLNQQYTMFLSDGTPVRATLTCTFKEWRASEDEQRAQGAESVDVIKTHIVARGETLSSIAAVQYDNPALWRPIAEANRIDNPRKLTPGQSLMIPALQT